QPLEYSERRRRVRACARTFFDSEVDRRLDAVGPGRIEIAIVAEDVVDAAGGDAGGRRTGQAVRRIAAEDMLLVEQVAAPKRDGEPLAAFTHRDIGQRDTAVDDERRVGLRRELVEGLGGLGIVCVEVET